MGTLYDVDGTTGSITSAGSLTVANPLTVANGGTGNATLTAHAVLLGEGTSTVAFAGPGTTGYVLTSNGASSNPTFQAPNGGYSTTTVTTTYTASTFNVILANATSGAFTVTLPSAASSANLAYIIKKIDSTANVVTIMGNGADTIDGVNTQPLNTQWQSYIMISNGTSWFLI